MWIATTQSWPGEGFFDLIKGLSMAIFPLITYPLSQSALLAIQLVLRHLLDDG